MNKISKWKVPLPGGQSRGSNLLAGLTALKLALAHCSAPRGLIARSPEMRCTVPVPMPKGPCHLQDADTLRKLPSHLPLGRAVDLRSAEPVTSPLGLTVQ